MQKHKMLYEYKAEKVPWNKLEFYLMAAAEDGWSAHTISLSHTRTQREPTAYVILERDTGWVPATWRPGVSPVKATPRSTS